MGQNAKTLGQFLGREVGNDNRLGSRRGCARDDVVRSRDGARRLSGPIFALQLNERPAVWLSVQLIGFKWGGTVYNLILWGQLQACGGHEPLHVTATRL